MVTREAMETAVAAKIDFLLNKLEVGKSREIDIVEQTKENYRRFHEEDALVEQLEEKLKQLEETLQKSETENSALETRLHTAEQQLEIGLEFNAAHEAEVSELETNFDAASKEFNSTTGDNNNLHRSANDISDAILKMSIELRNEEHAGQLEHERVTCLSKELNDVSTKLAAADRKREAIVQNGDELNTRVEAAELKRNESDAKVDEYDLEISRLEKLLEDHRLKLSEMKAGQVERERQIEEGKARIAAEIQRVEGQAKTTTIHQAQSVVKKRR